MALKLSHVLVPFFLLLALQALIIESRNLKNSGKFSNFLQNLEGVQKGQTQQGLQALKSYLKTFGYYPTEDINLDDNFDDHLESALKTYQNFYNLKVTGTLDSDTIKQMTMPRCGVPDIIQRSQRKNGNKNSSDHSPYLVADFAFNGGKWPSSETHLTYTFSSGVEVVDSQTLRTVISNAFKKWADVSEFTFDEAPEGSQSNIVIGFYSGDHGDGNPFDGPQGVLAHSYRPTDGRFHYDADENWSTNPDSDQIDLESVAVHEIGHLLGLAHSGDPNAVMYSGIAPGTIKRDLTQDDIDGIQTLYSN